MQSILSSRCQVLVKVKASDYLRLLLTMVAKIAGRLSDHQVSLSTCESEVMIQQIASDSGKKTGGLLGTLRLQHGKPICQLSTTQRLSNWLEKERKENAECDRYNQKAVLENQFGSGISSDKAASLTDTGKMVEISPLLMAMCGMWSCRHGYVLGLFSHGLVPTQNRMGWFWSFPFAWIYWIWEM